MVAHYLAKYAKNVSDYVVWIEDAPPQLYNVPQLDFANFLNESSIFFLKKKKKKKCKYNLPKLLNSKIVLKPIKKTKILLKPPKWLKYTPNNKNTPKTSKMAKILHKISKMTKKKNPKIPINL